MRSLIVAVALFVATAMLPAQERPHVVFLVGESEYGSQKTMPRLAKRLETELQLRTTVLFSTKNELPSLAALDSADLLVLFLRFRTATDAQLDRLRAWFDAGKPAIALRTTSHAFLEDKGWFPPFFGGHYKSHAPNGEGTITSVPGWAQDHELLHGIGSTIEMGHGGTYNAQPLSDTASVILLGRTGDLPSEPVAWTNEYRPGSRIFYTSLGSRENFERADFQRLLGNAALWCLKRDVPATGAFAGGEVRRATRQAAIAAPPTSTIPTDATVLFDGTDTDSWRHWDPSTEPLAIGIDRRADSSSGGPVYAAARWPVSDAAMVSRPGFGDVVTKSSFGNYHLHVDFLVPAFTGSADAFRGRSGIYLAGRYEIEIADSFGTPPSDESVGAIYGEHAPLVNAALPAGKWQSLDLYYSHVQDRWPVVSAWLNGQQIHDAVQLRERTTYGFRRRESGASSTAKGAGVRYALPPEKSFQFGTGTFAIAARFRTKGNGTLAGKCPPTGEWRSNSKALFLRDGHLVYDIGWVGQIESERTYNDGKWHRVMLTLRDGHARMFVDGALVADRDDFTAKDEDGHVFKIGAASDDFGGPYAGQISGLVVYEHDVGDAKAQQWTRGEVVNLPDPSLSWQPEEGQSEPEEPEGKLPVLAPIRLQADSSQVRFANVWLRPLSDVASAAGVGEMDDSEWPGYRKMNYGNALHWTYQVDDDNIAQKGIAVRVDAGAGGLSHGRAFVVYDEDTMRMAAAWTGEGFIDFRGVAFDGSHNSHAKIVGDIAFVNANAPGWAHPETGSFEDQRLVGRDGKRYGPLPRSWLRFLGRHQIGNQTVLEYRVGEVAVRESPGFQGDYDNQEFLRTLEVGPSATDMWVRLAPQREGLHVRVQSDGRPADLSSRDGFRVLRIRAGQTTSTYLVTLTAGDVRMPDLQDTPTEVPHLPARDASAAPLWSEVVVSEVKKGDLDGAYAVDELLAPDTDENPWHSWMRFGGFDFFAGGKRAAVATWNGDVWTVDGIGDAAGKLRWRRIAAGLFQPLGVRIVDGVIYVGCRDQICVLEDRNDDGETDYYRCFNNDHQVTEHFHEFAMGLQTDEEGNFYYAKSARHALPALVPHHGTLLKVSADGARTEILANGFRAANGVCVNGDGSFYVTDQEGHWTPKNRINRVEPGGFYGNMMGFHERDSSKNEDMEQPLCWLTNSFDRSPAELVRVAGTKWGLAENSLLELSYGMGRIYLVLEDKVDGVHQASMVAMPMPPFPTGVMRGRFHPGSGQLYCCGLYGWSGARTRPGGFYRVRYSGLPVAMPTGMKCVAGGLQLTFGVALDPEIAVELDSYSIETWSLRRSRNYGSKHYDEKSLSVSKVTLAADGKSVRLTVPELKPTMCVAVRCDLETVDGDVLRSLIHGTLHNTK